MNGEITKIESLNNIIDRIYVDHNITLDIHKELLECKVGEKIKVNISDHKIQSPTYLAYGQIYYMDKDTMCVSCGGLLFKFPIFDSQLGKHVFINVSKMAKRGRPPNNTSNKKQIT